MTSAWFQRIAAERRAGNLTRAEADALRAFGRLLAMGDDAPSEARIANEAACSRRSVQRAKIRARALGLLAWERRWARGRAGDERGTKQGMRQGLRRELPCRYRAETPNAPVVRRERQNGARKILSTERGLRRSAEAQIAACGPITPALLALWEARRLGLARSATRADHAWRAAPHAH